MRPLRGLSERPELLVDHRGMPIGDVTNRSTVGVPSPLGNERLVFAIPLNEAQTGPIQIAPHEALRDNGGYYIADPGGNLIGVEGLWVHRMVYARWTQDTRRLT